MAQDVIDRRTQRRKPDAAGDDQYILAACGSHGPLRTVRAAHSYRVAGVARDQPIRHRPDRAHGVDELFAPLRIAADRDRQLADAEDVEHAVLPGCEAVQRPAFTRLHRQRECVVRLFLNARDARSGRRHRICVHFRDRAHAMCSPVPRMAAASSVMSIPAGHQVMQRPQPTQPFSPNWSTHVASLCVIHWR